MRKINIYSEKNLHTSMTVRRFKSIDVDEIFCAVFQPLYDSLGSHMMQGIDKETKARVRIQMHHRTFWMRFHPKWCGQQLDEPLTPRHYHDRSGYSPTRTCPTFPRRLPHLLPQKSHTQIRLPHQREITPASAPTSAGSPPLQLCAQRLRQFTAMEG